MNDVNLAEHDARYDYYKHGPLARTIFGTQKVQGLDYAYTLQGWLKGVNATGLNSSIDMGGDGKSAGVAKDVFAFSLNYFTGEYSSISGKNPFPGYSAYMGNAYKPLYNGNITTMAVSIDKLSGTQLYNYTYDQLNRLTGMDTYRGFDSVGNRWSGLVYSPDYGEKISYDANGNILSYLRNGNGARLGMDKITYRYKPGTNQLDKVTDAAPDASASEYDKYNDIKQGQVNGNYQYDAIGNLIKDNSEKITNITWSVYGKILSIAKNAQSNGDVESIYYTYDAAGNRISKEVKKKNVIATDITWYVRDASGNVMSVYTYSGATPSNGTLYLTEQHLYGSSRIGVWTRNVDMSTSPSTATNLPLLGMTYNSGFERGKKVYELTNHLGNVLATISDEKQGIDQNSDGTIDYYTADVVSAQDYYPFGMKMPGRKWNATGYRYGFNGKEEDDEVTGDGNQYDYGFRIYNPRLGRFLSVDPLTKSYPWYTPYQFAGNMPILAVDLDGMEAKIVTIVHGTQNRELLRHERFDQKAEKVESGHWEIHHYYDFSTGNTVLLREEKLKIISEVKSPVGKINLSSASLGSLSENWESSGKGPGVISTGKGDPGGASYGIYQLASKTGTLQNFLDNEGAQWSSQFDGLEAGSNEFNSKWKDIAKTMPTEFRAAQHNFICRTHYQVQKEKIMSDIGMDIDKYSDVLKDVLWSTAVQHGPGNNVFKNALKGKDLSKMSEKEIIEAIYTERGSYNNKGKLKYFTKVSKDWKPKLINRFKEEKEAALQRLNQ